MTTILVLNAVSSLVALLSVAGFFALRERRARRRPAVQVLYAWIHRIESMVPSDPDV